MNNPKKVEDLLQKVVQEQASDLHLTEGHAPIIRKTRELIELNEFGVLSDQNIRALAFGLVSPQQQQELEEKKEIDFAYSFKNLCRFRINIFFQRGSLALALRVVPGKIKTLADLNLPSIIESFVKATQGLVLITGASSQGKSTTLAAMLDAINHQRKEHIITIEDPIEYVFQDDQSIIQQRELYRDTNSFALALRAVLREDPNVIMVGEMRDLETIATAITAAETGHLVFATLHTNSASQTIHRVIDVFEPHQQGQTRAQLSSSLLGVVSQRLLPAMDGNFLPVCEVLIANSAVRNLIREGKVHEIPAIIETSKEEGMIGFNGYLADLVKQGKISREVALLYAWDSKDLLARLSK